MFCFLFSKSLKEQASEIIGGGGGEEGSKYCVYLEFKYKSSGICTARGGVANVDVAQGFLRNRKKT